MRIDPTYLELAFRDGAARGTTLVQRPVGSLTMPSGALVACDPFLYPGDAQPFSLPLPNGTYPVVLTLAKADGDERVAFARLDVRAGMPAQWDLMTLEGQNQSELGPDEVFGYAVDTGTGCFADSRAAKRLSRLMQEDGSYWEQLEREIEKNHVDTWGFVNWALPDGLNVVAFSSGYGDGIYGTYVALDSSGELLSVVTDFMVLAGENE